MFNNWRGLFILGSNILSTMWDDIIASIPSMSYTRGSLECTQHFWGNTVSRHDNSIPFLLDLSIGTFDVHTVRTELSF